MYIENTYPSHTTKEEWDELALLAAKLLSAMAIPLLCNDGIALLKGERNGSDLCTAITG